MHLRLLPAKYLPCAYREPQKQHENKDKAPEASPKSFEPWRSFTPVNMSFPHHAPSRNATAQSKHHEADITRAVPSECGPEPTLTRASFSEKWRVVSIQT